MLQDFVLETVSAPGTGATITLPGVAPTGRRTWASAFVTSQQYVFYVLDDSIQQEWGVGALNVGSPSTISRPATCLGNSAGTTVRLNFASATRCYSGFPSAAALSALQGRVSHNLFHNSTDRIQQRGVGPITVAGYLSDRWVVSTGTAGGTRSVTIGALADAARVLIGDEEAQFYTGYTFSGGSGAGDLDQLLQRVENLHRTSNQNVTVSFWANSLVAGVKLGVNLTQNFGSGGSPSAIVFGTAQSVTLTTTWTRYALTFAVPSVSGKTFGTNANSDFLAVGFYMSSGTTNNAIAGSIGVQAGTANLYGRQLEVGSFPTPIEKTDIRYELSNCQRFYQIGFVRMAAYSGAGSGIGMTQSLPVTMRAAPTVVPTFTTTTNCSAGACTALDGDTLYTSATVTALGAAVLFGTFTATADL